MLNRLHCSAALFATVCALAVVACGDDDENGSTGYGGGTKTEQTDSATTEAAQPETSTDGAETGGADNGGATAPSTSPESQEGGAGDEVPASSQALVTGNGGELHPGTVHVPPFIAIRVQLRSEDGVEYELSGGGKTIKAGGEIQSASTTFEGLRAGRSLVLAGPQGKVTIVADAEPGP